MTMTFTTLHIALTAATVAVLTVAVGMWRLPHRAWRQALVIALLSGAAVFLWRLSANKPDPHDDGLPRVSAHARAAPIPTHLTPATHADPPPPARPRPVPPGPPPPP